MVHPREPTTSKVRVSVRKFCMFSNVTGRSIFTMGSASIPGTTPWNVAVDSLNWDCGMPISSSVDA
jgi:hypothetical protein